MTQSDEKSSSHQSLAANNAALYALPGKQTTTAPEQKTVRREDGIAFGKVNVESIQSCIMCGSHGFEHQRAQQQERDSPWNPQALGTRDLGYCQIAHTFFKAYRVTRLQILVSPDSLRMMLKSGWRASRALSHCQLDLLFDILLAYATLRILSKSHLEDLQHYRWSCVERHMGQRISEQPFRSKGWPLCRMAIHSAIDGCERLTETTSRTRIRLAVY